MAHERISRPEALALMAGPVLALVFFLFEPGGLFIDPKVATDLTGRAAAIQSNLAATHITGVMIPLGLIIFLYGIAGVGRVAAVTNTVPAGLTRFGVLAVLMGGFGWILASGMAHAIIGAQPEAAITLVGVDDGITFISSLVISLGLAAFSLGLAAEEPERGYKTAALAVTVISLISVAALIGAKVEPNQVMVTVGRLCYFPWVAWSVLIGRRYYLMWSR